MQSVFTAVVAACVVLLGGAVRADLINGRDYVSLGGWAKASGLVGYSLNGATQFVLTNRTTRLIFNQDSDDSTINGVNVRLSYPVAKGGYISQLDLDKTVRPLIYTQKPLPRKVTTICLDAGHGGKDTGYRIGRIFPRYEKNYTLALAIELRRQLQQAGFNVILTRDRDVYPELSTRPDLANRRKADLFISLHFNSFPQDPAGVHGPETYCMTPVGAASSNDADRAGAGTGAYPANRIEEKSLLFAYHVQRSLVRSLGATDRSVRRARFEVLRTAQMPAVLIEGGYMSNPGESKSIFDPAGRKQMAAAIVRAIVNFQKITAPPPPPNIQATDRPAAKTPPAKKRK